MTDAQDPGAQSPPTEGEALPCLFCGNPAVWTSPVGYHFCQEDKDHYQNLFFSRSLEPVDLLALMAGEAPEAEWMIEPILPAGKLCGIVSKRGEGKSLLLLEIGAARAIGAPTLNQPASDPVSVIYLDMEMGPEDLYERLASLGYVTDHPQFEVLRKYLHYYQLVNIPPLDTEAGGIALEELVMHHDAGLVIIDTVSRVVGGDENDAGPYRDLFRHTETRLKRRRVTLARLDHLGKDKERGSRGSSAKEDPLDVVWQLSRTITGAIELTLTKGRQEWLPRSVTIHREDDNGITRHVVPEEFAPDWLIELADRIGVLGLPPETSSNKILTKLKEEGRGARKSSIDQARRFLRGRYISGNRTPVTTPNGFQSPLPVTGGDHPSETLADIDNFRLPPSVTSPERVVTVGVPPKGGPTGYRGSEMDDFLEDFGISEILDSEPDLEDFSSFDEDSE